MEISIKKRIAGAIDTNVYYIIYGRHVLIADPAADADGIISDIESEGLVPSAIVITHGHYDHFGAASAVREHFNINVYAPAGDKQLFSDLDRNASEFVHGEKSVLIPDVYIKGGVELSFAGLNMTVLDTPGHTAGGISYYIVFAKDGYSCSDERFKDISGILVSGDTVFRGSIGRTDMPTADSETMALTIKNVIMKLPGDTLILPGHGPYTFAGKELERNPWFK